VDDTGARHKAANGFCTQIGNAHFAWFDTTRAKSPLNFLELLRVTKTTSPTPSAPGSSASAWRFYRDRKLYQANPSPQRKAALRARFDRIFKRRTDFVTLDRLLARLHANKNELLLVLDRPEIPLHTNGSENDIRCHVIRRKISGGTRSDTGRDCRDAFLSLAKNLRQARRHLLGLPR